MINARFALAGIVAAALLTTTACSSGDDTETGAEASLDKGFLNTLDGADLSYEVTSACHYYQRDGGDALHYAVHLTIDADMDTTTAALAPTVDIIDDRRPAAIVQQFAGEPHKGWTGQLVDNNDTTTLDLVKNNIDIDSGDRPSIGWLPVCTESLPG